MICRRLFGFRYRRPGLLYDLSRAVHDPVVAGRSFVLIQLILRMIRIPCLFTHFYYLPFMIGPIDRFFF